MPRKLDSTDRSTGGPGSSHEDATKRRPDPERKAADAPAPGTPTSCMRSRVSGGGGRDEHHTHDPRTKS